MHYERGSGELFYYDEHGNYIASYDNKNGVRQGWVLGAFLFCLDMQPVYTRLGALLGPEGALYAYSDDVYLIADPANMAVALSAAPTIYKNVDCASDGDQERPSLFYPLMWTASHSSPFSLKHASPP